MDKDIPQIAAWMRAAGIAEIELLSDGKALRLVVDDGTDSPTPDAPKVEPRHIRTAAIGALLLTHPLRSMPFVQAGDPVRAGDLVALLQAGPVYFPVAAPSAGVIQAIIAQAGARVGFGTPVFVMV